jgi:single-strand DNA-binding protein
LKFKKGIIMSVINVTLTGNVVQEPRYYPSEDNKRESVTLRLASTPRIRNKEGDWSDGTTTWLDVKAFGRLAYHVSKSVKKSDPIIVTGVMRTRIWEVDDKSGSTTVVYATAIGHNLQMGDAQFEFAKATPENVLTPDEIEDDLKQEKKPEGKKK